MNLQKFYIGFNGEGAILGTMFKQDSESIPGLTLVPHQDACKAVQYKDALKELIQLSSDKTTTIGQWKEAVERASKLLNGGR